MQPLGTCPPPSRPSPGAPGQAHQGAGVWPPRRLPGVCLVRAGPHRYSNPEGLPGEQRSTDGASQGRARHSRHLAEHRTRYRLWAWQFTAQIPRIAAAEMTDEEEVSIFVNGQQWDCVCDGWQSSQSFARESATLTGRSRTAYCRRPMSWRKAVSEIGLRPWPSSRRRCCRSAGPWTGRRRIGWYLAAFQPGQQTPSRAIEHLAEAAGGFVLPHQRDRHLVIKPRYPTVPWQLDGALATWPSPAPSSRRWAATSSRGRWRTASMSAVAIRASMPGAAPRHGRGAGRLHPSPTRWCVRCGGGPRPGCGGAGQDHAEAHPDHRAAAVNDTGLILPGALLAVDGWKGL